MGQVTTIEPSEWARRRRIIVEVRDSSRLDGGESLPEVQALQDRWVEGEITLDELRERVLRIASIGDPGEND